MMSAARISVPRFVALPPAGSNALRSELAHAERFARTLETLDARESDPESEEPAHVWLRGRASEVRAFAAEVGRSWMVGECDEVEAAASIEGYLESLHAALRPWYGEWYAPSCCGPCGVEDAEADARTPPSGARRVAVRVPSSPRMNVPPMVRRALDSSADTASMSGMRPVTRPTQTVSEPITRTRPSAAPRMQVKRLA